MTVAVNHPPLMVYRRKPLYFDYQVLIVVNMHAVLNLKNYRYN